MIKWIHVISLLTMQLSVTSAWEFQFSISRRRNFIIAYHERQNFNYPPCERISFKVILSVRLWQNVRARGWFAEYLHKTISMSPIRRESIYVWQRNTKSRVSPDTIMCNVGRYKDSSAIMYNVGQSGREDRWTRKKWNRLRGTRNSSSPHVYR